jgi:hypothetical protein
MKVLHILPNRFFRPEWTMLGSTKDMFGRIQFFYDRGIDFDIFAHVKNWIRLSDDLSFHELNGYSHIVVEHTYALKDFEYIKNRWPSARLIVRAHQSEILHREDFLTAVRAIKAGPKAEKEAIHSLQIYRDREEGAARFADTILSIEPHESEQYWRSLGFNGRFLFAPYFLPTAYVQQVCFTASPQQNGRKKQIVCVGSSHPGPLIVAMIQGFEQAVSSLENSVLPDWRFLVTGPWQEGSGHSGRGRRVEHLGSVDDLFGLLKESRAIAVMSALGRGFKTKVLDAIMTGAWVILVPELYHRLPEPIRPFCIVLRQRHDALAEAVAEIEKRQWPTENPNETLRSLSYEALDSAFGEF